MEPTMEDNMGKSPLHHAAARGRVATVRVLLELKADLNQTTKEEMTALHIAAEVGHADAVKALLEAGADPTVCDQHGRFPADLVPRGPRGKAVLNVLGSATTMHGDSSSGLLRQGSNGVQEARDNQLLLVLSTLLESIFSAFRFTFQRKSAPQKEE
mmetsp:Transcript_89087/g.237741  ORF Transcript_89087/g.237741 Transcript_89087/m.237741 type:complete len:156 (+) Transcript_89087:1457-1924(+)